MALTAISRSLHRPSLPVLEFLAPSWTSQSLRSLHSSTHQSSTATSTSSDRQQQPHEPPQPQRPIATLTPSQKEYLSQCLRINQAGELAATRIYTSQTPPLVRNNLSLRPLMAHMYEQEAGHLKTFNGLLSRHRIRPSALRPVWAAAANVLGWSTGMLGREAAMACTEAVETEIGDHYNDQVRVLLEWKREAEARGERLDDELEALLVDVRRIRDEELEHLDHAVENDAREATAWPVLTAVIRGGCRGAIWVAGKV